MSSVDAVAPGKLLLIGEYAVLDGAPALVMAVDRRVRVSIAPATAGHGWLNAPQLGIEFARMQVEDGELRCGDVPAAKLGLTGRMIPGIMRVLGRRPEEIMALNLEIDSAELFESGDDQPVKLGLGSSAAVSAALAVGLSAWFEPAAAEQKPRELLRKWLPVYRQALAASASGADLAAAFGGGLTEFCNAGDSVSCRPVGWPENLHWQAVWIGHAARTTDFVDRFEDWKRAQPEAAKKMRTRLGHISQRAISDAADGGALVKACAAYADALVSLGEAMGMEIMSAPHRRLADFARHCGVVYKSCGAGGGDLGIALATDADRIRVFENGVADHGGVPLNLKLSESGAGVFRRRLPDADENQ